MTQTTQTIITEVLKYLIPVILSFVVGWLSGKIKKVKQQKQAEDDEKYAVLLVVKYVAKRMIIDDCRFYIEQGFITPKELKDLKDLWNTYHNQLGGNGEGEEYFNKALKLEVKVE